MTDNATPTGPETVPDADLPADWRVQLPDDFRDHGALANFDDVAALAREHVHLQRLIGRKGIVPPGDGASEADLARFYDALGRPASAAEYDLEGIERPDGLPWNPDAESRMLERMHAAGLTNAQARALIEAYGAVQGEAWEEACATQARALEGTIAALRREWGSDYDARLDLANRAFRTAFGEAAEEMRQLRLADGSFLGDHPEMVRAFARQGAAMAEPAFVGPKSGDLGHSPESARTELAALERDPDFRAALLDRSHPDHRGALGRRSALTRRAVGEEA